MLSAWRNSIAFTLGRRKNTKKTRIERSTVKQQTLRAADGSLMGVLPETLGQVAEQEGAVQHKTERSSGKSNMTRGSKSTDDWFAMFETKKRDSTKSTKSGWSRASRIKSSADRESQAGGTSSGSSSEEEQERRPSGQKKPILLEQSIEGLI